MPDPPEGVRIEAMTSAHSAAVLAIYQAGIDEGNATFETRAPSWQAFTAARLPRHRYVAADAASVGRLGGCLGCTGDHHIGTVPRGREPRVQDGGFPGLTRTC